MPTTVWGQAVQVGGAYQVPSTAINATTGVPYPGNAAHMMNGLTRKNIYDETELRAAMENPFISEIWLMSDILLSGTALPALRNLRRLAIVGKCGSGTHVPYGGSDMCTIDAATLSGIFDVYGPAHLTLHNLRLTRGNVRYGGALAVWFGYADVQGCIMEDNTATRGGAFSNWHGEVVMLDVTLVGNTATYDGAAAYHWGGATSVKQSTIQGEPFFCGRVSMETYWNDDAGSGHSI
uniref:Right handed beta helix domain-containing protein n=1 Tax=Mantoniella antarctica TaxID=81844 RepID=A0A7S0S9L3_9CHLO